jgi:hypothetical protein
MKTITYVLILIWFCTVLSLIIPMASGNLGTFKQHECVQLKTILNSSFVNISTVSYPNSTIALNNQAMVRIGQTYIYSFCNTSVIGEYIYDYFDDHGNVYVNNFIISPSGSYLSGVQISIYIFFLLICLVLIFLFVKLIKTKSNKNSIEGSKLYELKKVNELSYYINVLKRQMWIAGTFGVYLSLLIFLALLNQLVYSLGLNDLANILDVSIIILSWGLIPFTLFWIGWLIIIFYKFTTETMKYQFGSMVDRSFK